jgi:hypothetical protein
MRTEGARTLELMRHRSLISGTGFLALSNGYLQQQSRGMRKRTRKRGWRASTQSRLCEYFEYTIESMLEWPRDGPCEWHTSREGLNAGARVRACVPVARGKCGHGMRSQ